MVTRTSQSLHSFIPGEPPTKTTKSLWDASKWHRIHLDSFHPSHKGRTYILEHLNYSSLICSDFNLMILSVTSASESFLFNTNTSLQKRHTLNHEKQLFKRQNVFHRLYISINAAKLHTLCFPPKYSYIFIYSPSSCFWPRNPVFSATV